MARFWILLFLVWYRAFTIVRTEDCEQSTSLDPLENVQKCSKDNNDSELSIEHEANSNNPSELYYEGKPEYKDENIKMEEDINELMKAIKLLPPRAMYDLKLGNLDNEELLLHDDSFRESYNPEDEFNVEGDYDDYRLHKRSFKTWGGKRMSPFSINQIKRGLDTSRTLPKRPNFVSWGGKRSNRRDEVSLVKSDFKKIPFNKWAGKRNFNIGLRPDNLIKEYVDYVSPLKGTTSIGRRRLKFNTWGGKRFNLLTNDEMKRNFQPWKGK